MADLGTYANLAEILGGIFVIGGLTLTVLELRKSRKQQHREAAFELLHSMQSTDMRSALRFVHHQMEPDLGPDELLERYGEHMDDLWNIIGQYEGLGLLVHHREIPIQLAEELLSVSIINTWNKLQKYAEVMRERTGAQDFLCYYQWMAERMMERQAEYGPNLPHITDTDWRPR